MKARPDRVRILEETKIPVLLIGGRGDNLIPFEAMQKMKALSPGIKLVCLENSGHMGFIEEKEKAVKQLKCFLMRILSVCRSLNISHYELFTLPTRPHSSRDRMEVS